MRTRKNSFFQKTTTFLLSGIMAFSALFAGSAPVAAAEMINGFDKMPSYDYAVKSVTQFNLENAEILSIPEELTYKTGVLDDAGQPHAIIGLQSIKSGTNKLGTISLLYRGAVIDASEKEYDLKIDIDRTYTFDHDLEFAENTWTPICYSSKGGTFWISSFGTILTTDGQPSSYTPGWTYGVDKEISPGLTAQQVKTNDDDSQKPVSRIRELLVGSPTGAGCETKVTFTVLDNGNPVEGKLLYGMNDLDTSDFHQMYVIDKQRYQDADGNLLVYTYGTDYKYNESVMIDGDVYVTDDTYLVYKDKTLHPTRISNGQEQSSFRTLLNTNKGSFTHRISGGATRLFIEPETFKITREVTGDYPNGGTINDEASGEDNVFWKQNRHYEITPANGYRVDKVWIDGKEVDPTESYDFEGVVANHEIKASFVPVERAVVIYKTNDGTELERSEMITGDQGASIEYSPDATIKKYTDKGYELTSNDIPENTVFDNDPETDQEFNIVLSPIIETITPDNPKTPEDKMNPDGTTYPEGLSKEDLIKTIKRTIHYFFEDGSIAQEPVVQNVVYTRTATVNHVTGEKTYTDWEPAMAKAPEKKSPDIQGYEPDKASVKEIDVPIDSNDLEETVVYAKLYTVTFVDGTGNTLKTQKGIKLHGSATAPSDPKREGYTFDGWDVAFNDITKDTTVTAKWKPVEKKAEPVETYTVIFDDGFGNILKTEKGIKKHGSATAPKDLTKEGFTFIGWDTGFDDITKDTTVIAKWQANPIPAESTYTVTFVDGFGKTLKTEKGIKLHGSATAPKDPTKDGYVFKGWDVKFDDITKDLTVTAKWEPAEKTFTATFVDGFGKTLKTQTGIKLNGSATAPDNPTKDGYVFKGWDTEFHNITKDITITAKWEKIPEKALTATPTVNKDGKVQTGDIPVMPFVAAASAAIVGVALMVLRKKKSYR